MSEIAHFNHIHFQHPINFSTDSITQKMAVQIAEVTDTAMYNAIIEMAAKENIGDLYLMDKQFVLDALRAQAERSEGCEYCKQIIVSVKINFEADSVLGENKWLSSTRQPKFCPMCGKPLAHPPKEDKV